MFDKRLFQLPSALSMFAALIMFSVLEAVCILGQAVGLSRALVGLWDGEAFKAVLIPFSVFSCSFVAVRIVLNLRNVFIESYAHKVVTKKREDLLDVIFRTGAPAVALFGTGTTAEMLLGGLDKVKSYLEIVLPKLANMMVLPLLFALAIFFADWVSGVVVIVLLPSMVLLMILIGKTTSDRGRSQHSSFKVMSNHFVDSVRGIATLSTFEVSKTYAEQVLRVSERFREATMRTLKTATLSGSVLDLFATLAIAAVSIMLGLRLIDGSLTLLPALFVLILVPEYFRPIREYSADYHASLEGLNSLKTIDEMIVASAYVPSSVHIEPWSDKSELALEDVGCSYDGVYALTDVSMCLKGHERICVVGKSGSGKSTLLRLLAGLEDPTNGSFSLSDSHIRLETLRQPAWQDQIAYIPQDPYLFHASLRDNLTFYNPHASQSSIDAAIEALGLKDLVAELPCGLETIIGEAGRGLSGGQAQRIALARALLDTKRKILLFDEPTAHLDIETEYELKPLMREAMEGKLVVFATHRLHWLDSFDRVLVLEGGYIVESGTREELHEPSSKLAQLIMALQGGASA